MYRMLTLLIGIVITLTGCGGKQVTRISPDTTVDLSGRWNDTDSRLVAQEMIDNCLRHRWITDHLQAQQGVPVVIVGAIHDKSLDANRIAVQTFISDIERAFIRSPLPFRST